MEQESVQHITNTATNNDGLLSCPWRVNKATCLTAQGSVAESS